MNRHALASLIDRLIVAAKDGDNRRVIAARKRLDARIAELVERALILRKLLSECDNAEIHSAACACVAADVPCNCLTGMIQEALGLTANGESRE